MIDSFLLHENVLLDVSLCYNLADEKCEKFRHLICNDLPKCDEYADMKKMVWLDHIEHM